MIKKERYLKFSIIVLDGDIMGNFVDDIILGSQKWFREPEKKNVIYDNILSVCSPGTFVHGMSGEIGLGQADYAW